MSIVSRPFRPAMACDACVWKRGDHALWCDVPLRFMGMTVLTDPTMEPGTIRLENAAGDCLGTIVNVGPPTASPWDDPWAKRKEPRP